VVKEYMAEFGIEAGAERVGHSEELYDNAETTSTTKKKRKKTTDSASKKKKTKNASAPAPAASVTPVDFQRANRQTMPPKSASFPAAAAAAAPSPAGGGPAPKGGGVAKISSRAAPAAPALTGAVRTHIF
jgi:hypothetical protein